MNDKEQLHFHLTPNAWALLPLGVFLLTYLVVSVVAGDFYKMPITVAFPACQTLVTCFCECRVK